MLIDEIFLHQPRSLIRETMPGLILWRIIGWLPFYTGMSVKTMVITIGFCGVLLTIFHDKYNRWTPSPGNFRDEGKHI